MTFSGALQAGGTELTSHLPLGAEVHEGGVAQEVGHSGRVDVRIPGRDAGEGREGLGCQEDGSCCGAATPTREMLLCKRQPEFQQVRRSKRKRDREEAIS